MEDGDHVTSAGERRKEEEKEEVKGIQTEGLVFALFLCVCCGRREDHNENDREGDGKRKGPGETVAGLLFACE